MCLPVNVGNVLALPCAQIIIPIEHGVDDCVKITLLAIIIIIIMIGIIGIIRVRV
jgi:hypothetical protein